MPGCDYEYEIGVNNSSKWYFGNGTKELAQIDFKFEAARQITDELGFRVNFKFLDSFLDTFPYVYPHKITTQDGIQFLRLSPFEKSLYMRDPYSRHENLLALSNQIEQINIETERLTNFVTQLDISVKPLGVSAVETILFWPSLRLQNMRQMLGDAFNGLIKARLDDGSMVHLKFKNDRYYLWERTPAEFLMREIMTAERSLNGRMDQYGLRELYGPRTLSLLEQIGYATVRKPQMVEFAPIRRSQFTKEEKID